MSYADVCEAVESLQRKYCERDPLRLCADMGTLVTEKPHFLAHIILRAMLAWQYNDYPCDLTNTPTI